MEKLNIDFRKKGKALPQMWSKCIGAGRACEGLRADWQKQLKTAVKECGFEYIRFHGLLTEDMFVYREVNGKAHYNWYYIDSLYDFLLETGIRPIVEFGFMPPELASGDGTQFWWKANVTPPKDYGKWAQLMKELVCHWKERYGLEEIRQWYYEIWNEPDLYAFWNGTKSQYFELYKVSVRAIKEVDASLLVGGPATSNFVPDGRFDGETEDVSLHITHRTENIDSLVWKGVWIEDFLAYCAKEGLPVDFVSTHPYPTDFALDGRQNMKGRSRKKDSLYEDLTWLNEILRSSAYPNAQIHLTEWSSSPTSRDYSHDFLPAADYIVRSNLQCAGMADSLSYWVFTDIFEEVGGGQESFHGGFGLMNREGIRKPAYHAYRFLHELDTEEVEKGEGYAAARDEDGKAGLLLWNYARELEQAVPISAYPDYETAQQIELLGETKELAVKAEGLKPNAFFKVEILDRQHSTAYQWLKMGRPENLTKRQREWLARTLPAEGWLKSDENGRLDTVIRLEPWSLVLVKEI